jgi:beta-galactosidase GanA
MYPGGTRHYKFSSEHGHHGFWCGDYLARENFKKCMEEKYGSVEALNKAWGTSYDSFDKDKIMVPVKECTRMQRIDLYKWYSESLINFCDKVCAIIRKHFPDIRGGMPIGVPRDSFGISKTEAVRLCAKYNVQARWTGWAHYEDFEQSEVLAKRVSSPARFYGTDFGEEAALEIYEDNAGNAVYEAITNGTVLIHNDPENYMRAPELYKSLHTLLTGEQPVIDTGVLYPFENEYVGAFDDEEFMYDENGNRTFDVAFRAFVRDLAPVRRMTNYELADSKMIAGGFLDTVKRMIVPNGSYIPQETINALEDWAKKGGELLFLGKAKVMETDEEINTDGRQLVLEDSEQYVTEFPTRFVYFNRASGEITEKKK